METKTNKRTAFDFMSDLADTIVAQSATPANEATIKEALREAARLGDKVHAYNDTRESLLKQYKSIVEGAQRGIAAIEAGRHFRGSDELGSLKEGIVRNHAMIEILHHDLVVLRHDLKKREIELDPFAYTV